MAGTCFDRFKDSSVEHGWYISRVFIAFACVPSLSYQMLGGKSSKCQKKYYTAAEEGVSAAGSVEVHILDPLV